MLKIPSGSCFYRLSAHEDTQHINRTAEENSLEVAWPCEQSTRKTENILGQRKCVWGSGNKLRQK